MNHFFRLLTLTLLCLALTPPATHANEGAGLIVSDLDGALPKALWRGQNRSEIVYLLKNMPPAAPLKSLQKIKRELLLSQYDISLINNDIEVKDGEDLLTLRLRKLIEMGLWDDAFTLYTRTTADPANNNMLAQTGVLLIFYKKGLSTACLEEKVLSPRFPDSPFWQKIDNICDAEIGTDSVINTQFDDSTILKAIYSEPNFSIAANDLSDMGQISFLELALLAHNKKINYQNIDLNKKFQPYVLKTFLEDTRFPAAQRPALESKAVALGITKESENTKATTTSPIYIENASQSDLTKHLSTKLFNGQEVSTEEAQKLLELAPENPQNFLYLQMISHLGLSPAPITITTEDLERSILIFDEKSKEKAENLKSLLDIGGQFSNNRRIVYEKHISLTPSGHYVMGTSGLTNWLAQAVQNQFAGLSLLIILSNYEMNAKAQTPDTNQEKTITLNALNSLSAVGLIDKAHLIATEQLALLMGEF